MLWKKSKHNQREIVVLFGYFNSSAMYWTEEHDRLMCREILAVDPFTGTKKGTVQRGAKWKIIADNLSEIMEPKFKVDPRGVRDRYQLLAQKLRKKLKDEQKASGIDTEMSETENAIEELLEKEEAAESMDVDGRKRQSEQKERDKENAEDMRRQAMERMGQTQKRKSDLGENENNKKKRSSGSDTLLYLRERNELLQETRKEELALRKQELELQEKKQEDFMKLIVQQQQQQSKQIQDFQAIMLSVLGKFGQK